MGLNFVICVQCEISKAKDYTITLLAKYGLDDQGVSVIQIVTLAYNELFIVVVIKQYIDN